MSFYRKFNTDLTTYWIRVRQEDIYYSEIEPTRFDGTFQEAMAYARELCQKEMQNVDIADTEEWDWKVNTKTLFPIRPSKTPTTDTSKRAQKYNAAPETVEIDGYSYQYWGTKDGGQVEIVSEPDNEEVYHIGVWFENWILTDYDGTYCIGMNTIKALRKFGFTVPSEFVSDAESFS